MHSTCCFGSLASLVVRVRLLVRHAFLLLLLISGGVDYATGDCNLIMMMTTMMIMMTMIMLMMMTMMLLMMVMMKEMVMAATTLPVKLR